MEDRAAQIFDNAMIVKILQMFPFYYNQRVKMSPKEYYDKMVKNDIGRVDLDGICPYTGEDDEGNLLYPSDEAIKEWFDQKAKPVPWSQEIMFAGRPFECMKPTIDLLMKIEKMLAFLVESGFTPERLQFLVPMSRMQGTNDEKAQMRHVISNFLARLLKGAFPDKKHYAYFRHVNEGFEEVIHFTPLIVYFAHRVKERSDEVLITAKQSGVILPPDFQAKIDFTMSYASAEAARGKHHRLTNVARNLEQTVVKAAIGDMGDTAAAKMGRAAAEAAAKAPPRVETPKSYAPQHPPPSIARNKRSLALDLRQPEGRQLLRQLAGHADVLVENFKPGTLERWDMAPETLRQQNPGLIVARVSGYGQTGPKSTEPGFASVCEGVGGFRFVNGVPGDAPVRPNLSMGDTLAGMNAVLGILLALLKKDAKPSLHPRLTFFFPRHPWPPGSAGCEHRLQMASEVWSCFEAFRKPSLPRVDKGCPLHLSLAKLGHDEEDVTEVLCNPFIKQEHLSKHVDDLPNLLAQLAAFDDDPAVEATLEVVSVFAYGTLRGDFGLEGDKWGILKKSNATWQKAFVQGFQLYQDPRLTYPFAVKTGRAMDIIVGTVISWPSADVARENIANCNQVEGFKPSEPEVGVYRRSVVSVLPMEPGPVTKALIYHQSWPAEMLEAAMVFPDGDWLKRI
eukprot:s49_g37.t2